MAEPERSLALPPHSARAARTATPPEWESRSDEELLDLRLSDLGLRIRGSELEPRIKQLYRELRAAGFRHFRPHFWLSDDWYTPDGVPGVAIPFYMAHPRLAKLEFAQMLEVEGGTPEWCLRILRHEAGHALDNAYLLRRRHRRQQLFGLSSKPYPEYYTPRPYSRSFVLHLEPWYAQSHPDEDFAETFAVWLTPDSPWRSRYQDWPALKKLEYVDGLHARDRSATAARRQPPHRRPAVRPPQDAARALPRQAPALRHRLLERLRPRPAPSLLRRARGARQPDRRRASSAASGSEVRVLVARWTGEYQYTINQVIDEIDKRCRELNLRVAGEAERAKIDFTIFVAVQTMQLPAQRPAPGVALMKTLRILALVHEDLVPPDDVAGVDTTEVDWKMEFDVTVTLRNARSRGARARRRRRPRRHPSRHRRAAAAHRGQPARALPRRAAVRLRTSSATSSCCAFPTRAAIRAA